MTCELIILERRTGRAWDAAPQVQVVIIPPAGVPAAAVDHYRLPYGQLALGHSAGDLRAMYWAWGPL